MKTKNMVMIALTVLVIVLIVWRHKTCPECQKNLKKTKDKVMGR